MINSFFLWNTAYCTECTRTTSSISAVRLGHNCARLCNKSVWWHFSLTVKGEWQEKSCSNRRNCSFYINHRRPIYVTFSNQRLNCFIFFILVSILIYFMISWTNMYTVLKLIQNAAVAVYSLLVCCSIWFQSTLPVLLLQCACNNLKIQTMHMATTA